MTKPRLRPRALLLDLDDTIAATIDTQWPKHKRIALERYGIELTDDKLRQHYGERTRLYLGNIYGTDDLEQAMRYSIEYRKQFPRRLHPGAEQALRALKAAGMVLGIVSASTREGIDGDCATILPCEVFDLMEGAEDTHPYHKPDPQVFDSAKAWLREHYGIEPHEISYVGDALYDGEAALAAGIGFIGVRTGLVNEEKFRAAGMVSIPSVADLPAYFGIEQNG